MSRVATRPLDELVRSDVEIGRDARCGRLVRQASVKCHVETQPHPGGQHKDRRMRPHRMLNAWFVEYAGVGQVELS